MSRSHLTCDKGNLISRNWTGKNLFFTDNKSPEVGHPGPARELSYAVRYLCSVQFSGQPYFMCPVPTSFSTSAHCDYVLREEKRANGQSPNSNCQLTAFLSSIIGNHSQRLPSKSYWPDAWHMAALVASNSTKLSILRWVCCHLTEKPNSE